MMKVGITGGIGSGKTYVCKIFETLGVPVYYSDIRAKDLMVKNGEVKNKIKSLFGGNAYHKNGRLNRAYLAEKIFSDPSLRSRLNAIVHPAVAEDGVAWFAAQKSSYALKEAAILIETGSYKDLDKIILVVSPLELRINRVAQRDKIDRDQIIKRIKSQMADEEKMKYADDIIFNDEEHDLMKQVMDIHNKYSNLQ
jgi:dephospho-CoA kinase